MQDKTAHATSQNVAGNTQGIYAPANAFKTTTPTSETMEPIGPNDTQWEDSTTTGTQSQTTSQQQIPYFNQQYGSRYDNTYQGYDCNRYGNNGHSNKGYGYDSQNYNGGHGQDNTMNANPWDNSYRINTFNKSYVSFRLKTYDQPDKADVLAIAFYQQFQSHCMQHGVGLKKFGQLGPDVEDYYKPSPSAITKLDRQ